MDYWIKSPLERGARRAGCVISWIIGLNPPFLKWNIPVIASGVG